MGGKSIDMPALTLYDSRYVCCKRDSDCVCGVASFALGAVAEALTLLPHLTALAAYIVTSLQSIGAVQTCGSIQNCASESVTRLASECGRVHCSAMQNIAMDYSGGTVAHHLGTTGLPPWPSASEVPAGTYVVVLQSLSEGGKKSEIGLPQYAIALKGSRHWT